MNITIESHQEQCSECQGFFAPETLARVAETNHDTGMFIVYWMCCPQCRQPGVSMIVQAQQWKRNHHQ